MLAYIDACCFTQNEREMALLIAKEDDFERRAREAEAKVWVCNPPLISRAAVSSLLATPTSWLTSAASALIHIQSKSTRVSTRNLLPGREGTSTRGRARPEAARGGGAGAARAGGEAGPEAHGGGCPRGRARRRCEATVRLPPPPPPFSAPRSRGASPQRNAALR